MPSCCLPRATCTRGLLANATVVATTMSNMGLEAALSRSGIAMLRAPVGDKYVLEQMLSTGATLGGEQSGHIIFSGRSTTGDGLLTALLVLDIIHRSGKSLAELTADLKTFPQVIVNVKVREKRAARLHAPGRRSDRTMPSRRSPAPAASSSATAAPKRLPAS